MQTTLLHHAETDCTIPRPAPALIGERLKQKQIAEWLEDWSDYLRVRF